MGDSSDENIRKARLNIGKKFALILLLVAACFGSGMAGGYLVVSLGDLPTIISHGVDGDGNAITSREEEDIASIAEKLGPSVVSVVTTSNQSSSIFGDTVTQGSGSGIVLTKDGYILTNKHVVSDSDSLAVITSDGAEHKNVKVIGKDPLNDLAFIKVSGVNNLKPAELGDSSTIRIGQKVIAIGNSLGEYQNTVTSGIISGTGRPVTAQEGNNIETLTDLLQTDAAINPGNSGGPLVNLGGQVIGINTAIAEDAQSIGFSIPINAAKGIIKNLKKTGKVERGFLGVNFVSITADIAKEYNLEVKQGAYIFSENGAAVVKGSPAYKAGLRKGDIITRVGELKVGKNGSLSSLMAEYATGETVQITYLRDGTEHKANVTLVTYNN